MPNAGDPFQVTESEKDARSISTKRQELKRFEAAKAVKKAADKVEAKDKKKPGRKPKNAEVKA